MEADSTTSHVNIMQIALAKSRSKRGHLTSQLLQIAPGLLVRRVCPVYLEDELVLVFYTCDCILYLANGGSVDVSLHMISMALVLWGVGAILLNGHAIQGKSYVALLLGTEMLLPKLDIRYIMFQVNYVECTLVVWWLAIESFILTVGDPFPEGENMNLRFISDVVNLLLKNTGGEAEGLILLFL